MLNNENNPFGKLSRQEVNMITDAYLSFSAKFIEYVREVDAELFKRASNYAETISDTPKLKKKK